MGVRTDFHAIEANDAQALAMELALEHGEDFAISALRSHISKCQEALRLVHANAEQRTARPGAAAEPEQVVDLRAGWDASD